MTSTRTIAIVTGTRAEYGLLKRLCLSIENHPTLKLRLIVTGDHLSKRAIRLKKLRMMAFRSSMKLA